MEEKKLNENVNINLQNKIYTLTINTSNKQHTLEGS